ncbi:hypothetical protein BaRGS_00033547, partial [Batillaria attramentaria]
MQFTQFNTLAVLLLVTVFTCVDGAADFLLFPDSAKMGWNEGRQLCEDNGMTLAIIDEDISNYFAGISGEGWYTSAATKDFWIALFDSDISDTKYSLYLTAYPGLNYTETSVYQVSITCEDTRGGSDTDTFYVYIVINGMPTILNLHTVGSQVFEVLTYDSEGDTLTFTLTCVTTTSCPFTIYASGVILLSSSVVSSTDHAYELDITVTDGYHATAAHRLTVHVT